MKIKLTQDEHNELPDVLKAEYTQSGDSFLLKAEGDAPDSWEPIKGVLTAKQRANEELSGAKAKLAELTTKHAELETRYEDRLKSGPSAEDFNTLQESFNAKAAALETQYGGKLSSVQKQLETMIVNDAVSSIADKFVAPKVMRSVIASRLNVVADDNGSLQLRVLDESGKPSAHSLEDLATEFLTGDDYKAMLKPVDNSSGSGRAETTVIKSAAGRAAATQQNYLNMTPSELLKKLGK